MESWLPWGQAPLRALACEGGVWVAGQSWLRWGRPNGGRFGECCDVETRPHSGQRDEVGVRIISGSTRQCFLECGGWSSGSAFDQAASGGQGFVVFQIPDGT